MPKNINFNHLFRSTDSVVQNVFISLLATTVTFETTNDVISEEVINEKEVYDTTISSVDDKYENVHEENTRGIDFKGNIRYFCPRCNVRYIGKIYRPISYTVSVSMTFSNDASLYVSIKCQQNLNTSKLT